MCNTPSKNFLFFFKSITPISKALITSFVMPSLSLRYRSVSPSLLIRFKSVPITIGSWDLHRTCKGGRRELHEFAVLCYLCHIYIHFRLQRKQRPLPTGGRGQGKMLYSIKIMRLDQDKTLYACMICNVYLSIHHQIGSWLALRFQEHPSGCQPQNCVSFLLSSLFLHL